MKTIFASVVIVLLISTAAFSQSRQPVQEQRQNREQTQIEANQHGNDVSTVAKEVPGGPGKGEVVSNQALTKRDQKRLERQERKQLKRQEKIQKREQKRMQDGTGSQQRQQTARPQRPERPNQPNRPDRSQTPARSGRPR